MPVEGGQTAPMLIQLVSYQEVEGDGGTLQVAAFGTSFDDLSVMILHQGMGEFSRIGISITDSHSFPANYTIGVDNQTGDFIVTSAPNFSDFLAAINDKNDIEINIATPEGGSIRQYAYQHNDNHIYISGIVPLNSAAAAIVLLTHDSTGARIQSQTLNFNS